MIGIVFELKAINFEPIASSLTLKLFIRLYIVPLCSFNNALTLKLKFHEDDPNV